MAGLIITNGDVAADLLADAGRTGTILPWRDILHEGPIVGGPLETASAVRAPWLAGRFRLDPAEVAAAFAERDALMRRHADFDTVELWFEHDLYDQLQLVQVLSFFADEGRHDGLLLVQADDFLGAERPDTVLRFAERGRAVAEEDLDAADFVWADLAMPTPEAIARRIEEPAEAMPFLVPALHRFLEELPAPMTGLGRTEAEALGLIAAGVTSPLDLFRTVIGREEAAFMGDLSFFRLIEDLAVGAAPLVAGLPDRQAENGLAAAVLSLTDMGKACLAGEADHVALNGLDRWWGGTLLLGADVWRYDRGAMRLVPPAGAGA